MARFKLFLLLFFLCGNVFAVENLHAYPKKSAVLSQKAKDLKYPGYCEIEIINDSNSTVRVSGIFDDGAILMPFKIYPYEYPHYISLFYYGYCHYGMNLYIRTRSGYMIYSGYTTIDQTVYIMPYMASKPKAQLKSRQDK